MDLYFRAIRNKKLKNISIQSRITNKRGGPPFLKQSIGRHGGGLFLCPCGHVTAWVLFFLEEESMKTATETTLTKKQIQEAKKQERIVDNGLSSYVEVGLALRKIQTEKLHAGKFIDYAMDRFALKSHTIYRLMRAAEVAKNLMDADLPAPKNAGQAHSIHDICKDDPVEQISLWKKVTESGVPISLSEILKFAENQEDDTDLSADTSEYSDEVVGEVDMNSAHHVEPKEFQSSDADPLPCLQRATQELQAVTNAIADGFDDLDSITDEVERLAELLDGIRGKLGSVQIAA